MAERKEKIPYYEQVAGRLIEQIEAGTAPWQKRWEPGKRPRKPKEEDSAEAKRQTELPI